jgi:tetratricopeptide (TPR) repeat protein
MNGSRVALRSVLSRVVECLFCALVLLFLPIVCSAQWKSPHDARGSLSGKIQIDDQSVPSSQVRVEVRQLSENWSVTAITDRDGSFRLEGLPTASYLVTVNAPGFAPFEQTLQVDSATMPLLIRLRKNSPDAGNPSARSVSVRELRVPEKARKSFDKGNRLLQAHDSTSAISEFQRAIKVYPDFYEAYYKIGVAEAGLNQGTEAESAFRKAIEVSDGRFAPAQSGLSVVLAVERRFPEAEAAARADLELDATDATGHYALALVWLATDRIAEAEQNVLEALRYKPAFAEAYLLLAQVHSRQNNVAALVADLDSYLKLDPDSPRASKARAARADAQKALLQQVTGAALAKANP